MIGRLSQEDLELMKIQDFFENSYYSKRNGLHSFEQSYFDILEGIQNVTNFLVRFCEYCYLYYHQYFFNCRRIISSAVKRKMFGTDEDVVQFNQQAKFVQFRQFRSENCLLFFYVSSDTLSVPQFSYIPLIGQNE